MKTKLFIILVCLAAVNLFAAGGSIGTGTTISSSGGGGTVSTTPTTNIVDTTALVLGTVYTNTSGSNLLLICSINTSGVNPSSYLYIDNNHDGNYENTNTVGHSVAAGAQIISPLIGTINPNGIYKIVASAGTILDCQRVYSPLSGAVYTVSGSSALDTNAVQGIVTGMGVVTNAFGRVYIASKNGAILNSSLLSGGGTEDTQAIQRMLDQATNGPVEVIIDGVALVGTNRTGYTPDGRYSALLLHSNTKLTVLSGGGLYLRDDSNCRIIGNTLCGGDGIGQSNIVVSGGFWNLNGENQSLFEAGAATYTASNYMVVGVEFSGVDGLTLENLTAYNSRDFCIQIDDSSNIKVLGVSCVWSNKLLYGATAGNDGLHFWGNMTNLLVRDFYSNGSDDCFAFNTDESSAVPEASWPRWSRNGDGRNPDGTGHCKGVRIENVFIDDASNLMRIYSAFGSSTAKIDDIHIRGVRGSIRKNWPTQGIQGFAITCPIGIFDLDGIDFIWNDNTSQGTFFSFESTCDVASIRNANIDASQVTDSVATFGSGVREVRLANLHVKGSGQASVLTIDQNDSVSITGIIATNFVKIIDGNSDNQIVCGDVICRGSVVLTNTVFNDLMTYGISLNIAPPVTPIDPATLSPVLYLSEAGLTNTVDGSPVSTWADSSSSNNDATGATDLPTFKTAGFNGTNCVSFDGSQYLSVASISTPAPYTVICVGKLNVPTVIEPNVIISSASPAAFYINAVNFSTPFNLGFFDGGSYVSAIISDSAATNGCVFSMTMASNNDVNFYLNGTKTGATSSATTSNGFDSSTIIGSYGPSTYTGDAVVILVFDSVLSSGNRAGVELWLKNKYGL